MRAKCCLLTWVSSEVPFLEMPVILQLYITVQQLHILNPFYWKHFSFLLFLNQAWLFVKPKSEAAMSQIILERTTWNDIFRVLHVLFRGEGQLHLGEEQIEYSPGGKETTTLCSWGTLTWNYNCKQDETKKSVVLWFLWFKNGKILSALKDEVTIH